MRRSIGRVSLAVLVAAGVLNGAAAPDSVPEGSGDVETVVLRNLDQVRSNLGGWCGTPEASAYSELMAMGAAAVPVLISARNREEYRDVERLILEVLSDLTCRDFLSPRPRDETTRALEAWWRESRDETRETWILDAARDAAPGNTPRLAFGLREVRSPESLPRMILLLRSSDPDVEIIVLYALWDNYRSEEALRHVRATFRSGSPEQKRDAIRFVGSREVPQLHADLVGLLSTETDYGTLSTAIDVAGERRLPEAAPILRQMEADPPGHPLYNVIKARARIERSAYRDRLREHLAHGARGERFAAVQVVDEVMPAEEACPLLLEALNDPDTNVARYAATGLRRLSCEASERPAPGAAGIERPHATTGARP